MDKRILCVVTRSEMGGAQKHVLELVAGLNKQFRIAVASGGAGYLMRSLQSLGAPVYHLQKMRSAVYPPADLHAVRELLAVMRDWQPDLVHVHSAKAGVIGRIAAKLAGIPSVYTVHGWAFTDGVPLLRKTFSLVCEAACSGMAQRIVTVSDYDRMLCLRYRLVPPNEVVTIRNGVPGSPLRACPAEGSPPVIVMIARFDVPKDHGTLLRAVAGLPDRFRLILVGDGPLRPSIEKQARDLGINENVDLPGTREDVAEILSQSHIAVLASRWEAMGICNIEAMRAGLPVVASDVGGVREAVQDGVTGFLVKRGDVEGLRERLRLLLQNPDLRARMGAAGRKRYLAEFTLDSTISKTRDLYLEVLGQSEPARPMPIACAPVA